MAQAQSDRPVQEPNLFRWTAKGGLAILDQGLFAVTSFLMYFLLARWMAPTEFGAFAVAYSLFVLLATFHTALLTEPMLVFGPGKYAGEFSSYLGLVIGGHLAVTAAISLLLALGAIVLILSGLSTLGSAVAGLAISASFLLLLWLARRAFYAKSQPEWAALGSGTNLLLLIPLLYIVHKSGSLTPFSAFGIAGLVALLVSLLLLIILRPGRIFGWRTQVSHQVMRDHLRYGKWSSGTAVLSWMPANIYYSLLLIWVGLEASGALRAKMNFVMPMVNVITAISILVVPQFVRVIHAEGRQGLSRPLRNFLLISVAISVIYWVAIAVLEEPLVARIYGPQYGGSGRLLWIFGLVPVFVAVSAAVGSALRALERPDLVLLAYAVASIAALILGVWWTRSLGVMGAGMAMVTSYAVIAGIMSWSYLRRTK